MMFTKTRNHSIAERLFMMILATGILFACRASGDVPGSSRSAAAVAKQLPGIEARFAELGISPGAPVFLRVTKAPAELTAFVQGDDGRYMAFQTWDICSFSGGLGPKMREGDGKSPEGFYSVAPEQMNPNSSFHLSFNLGFPNAYDRAQDYTGSYLMVHGACVSIGCYAMTDEGIEEIWTLMQLAFDGGQTSIPIHVFPFAMPDGEVPEAYASHPAAAFWAELGPGWDAFEETGRVPEVRVVEGRYEIVSPRVPDGVQ